MLVHLFMHYLLVMSKVPGMLVGAYVFKCTTILSMFLLIMLAEDKKCLEALNIMLAQWDNPCCSTHRSQKMMCKI